MNIRELAIAFLEKWGATIAPAVVGLVSGIVLASYNSQISNNRYFLERQVATANDVATHFSSYVENFRRMVNLRKDWEARKVEPTATEQDTLRTWAKERNTARDKLFSSLDALVLYFGDDVVKAAYDFREWDEKQATKLIEQLPEMKEWKERARALFVGMRRDMRQ